MTIPESFAPGIGSCASGYQAAHAYSVRMSQLLYLARLLLVP
jgi:hypothetical protein